ncbi:hypothetical protein ACHWQZ_G003273 [Mnemiopsis leidyi]
MIGAEYWARLGHAQTKKQAKSRLVWPGLGLLATRGHYCFKNDGGAPLQSVFMQWAHPGLTRIWVAFGLPGRPARTTKSELTSTEDNTLEEKPQLNAVTSSTQ